MTKNKTGPKKGPNKIATTIYLQSDMLEMSRFYAKRFKNMTFTAYVEYLLRKEMAPSRKKITDAFNTAFKSILNGTLQR